ncbi:hypothetical protein Javan174_0002 [Streptococcus phage Javan174]|uniref:Ltp family lipoprotein n=1 Tax=Streptococcus entericus TaxID=155680 RepID=UPI00036AA77E|nr:Ltp family lipoprotein [Streptococcus entericus]QBX24068.1 hypothetical protein Javan174_0002 [Streptococcus phage Javan174]
MKKLLSYSVITLSALALVACSSETSTKETASSSSATEKVAASSSQDNIPTDYKTALKKAENYLDTIPMSKEGLRNQLIEFEKYSEEAAQYAVDNIKADWNEQALKKAKDYQETVAMSPEAIRTQLVDFEKFTQEEADYAVANLN